MAVALEELHRSWWSELQSGTASALSSMLGRRSPASQSLPTQPVRPSYRHVSQGVSASALLVENSVDDLMDDIDHWLAAPFSTAEEVEQDMLVLLPPKQQYIAHVEIIGWQRPGILIGADDFSDSSIETELAG